VSSIACQVSEFKCYVGVFPSNLEFSSKFLHTVDLFPAPQGIISDQVLGVPGSSTMPGQAATRGIVSDRVAFRALQRRRRPDCIFCRVEVWRHAP